MDICKPMWFPSRSIIFLWLSFAFLSQEVLLVIPGKWLAFASSSPVIIDGLTLSNRRQHRIDSSKPAPPKCLWNPYILCRGGKAHLKHGSIIIMLTHFLTKIRADWDSNCQLLALRWYCLSLSFPKTNTHLWKKFGNCAIGVTLLCHEVRGIL